MTSAGNKLFTVFGGGPGLDPDAATYIAATGATDTAAISEFARRIKLSTLDWSLLAICPARSGQQAAGTTWQTLGGLEVGNVTAESPGATTAAGTAFSGITANAAALGYVPSGAVGSIISIVTLTSTSGSDRRIIGFDKATTNQGLSIDGFGPTGFRRLSSDFVGNFGTRSLTPSMIGVGHTSGDNWTAQDSTYTTDSAGSLVTSTIPLAFIGKVEAGGAKGSFSGVYAAGLYYAGSISAAMWAELRTIYKETLGLGLGLP